jgi:hypothetical protein
VRLFLLAHHGGRHSTKGSSPGAAEQGNWPAIRPAMSAPFRLSISHASGSTSPVIRRASRHAAVMPDAAPTRVPTIGLMACKWTVPPARNPNVRAGGTYPDLDHVLRVETRLRENGTKAPFATGRPTRTPPAEGQGRSSGTVRGLKPAGWTSARSPYTADSKRGELGRQELSPRCALTSLG